MAKGSLRGSSLGGRPALNGREPLPEELAPRQNVSFWCASGHESRLAFADDAVAPETADCRRCGEPAGQDREAPPIATSHVPYKTHMAYVRERRSEADGQQLLDEALARLRAR